MATIQYEVPNNVQRMTIGVQGENKVREFLFDVTEWRQITGNIGAAEMVVQRNGDTSPYAAAITMHDENTVSWVPTSTDTAKVGAGKLQLMWIAGGQTVKTKIFDMKVDPSLDYAVPDTSLDPWASWMPGIINADANYKGLTSRVDDLQQRQTSPYNFKGAVATLADLPSTGQEVNDTYYVEELKYRVTWTGEAWQQSSMAESEYEDELVSKTTRLVSKDNAITGYFSDIRTGAVTANVNFAYLDFGVLSGDTIVYCAARADTNIGICFYDLDGAFVSGIASTATEQTVLVPDSAVSAKASYRIAKADQAYVKLGASISPLVNRVTKIGAECARIVDGYLSKDDAVTGYAINSLDGSRMAQANLSYLEFPVLTGSKLVYNAGRDDAPVGLAFYDAEGVYVSGVASSTHGQTVAVPDTAVIARASYRTHLADVAYVKILTEILPLVEAARESNAAFMTLNEYCGLSMFGSVHFLGDSYTQGGIKSSDGSTWRQAKKPYPEVIGGELGITVKNFGIGGASVRSYLTDGLPSVLAEDAPDLYVLCFGINDAGHGDAIGSEDDIDDEDFTQNGDTYWGNYGKLIAQLKQHAPLARFVIFGQWHWNSGGIRYMDYSEAARGIAEHFGIPFVDPFRDAFFNSSLYRTTMVSGHPTQVTYTGMAHAVMRMMTDCISDNESYYRYAGLEEIS